MKKLYNLQTKQTFLFKVFWLSFIFVALIESKGLGAIITSTANGGNWNSGSTWVGSVVPQSGDEVRIEGTVTVNINNAVCSSLKVGVGENSTRTISFNSGSILVVSGDVELGLNGQRKGSINMSAGGLLKVGGSITVSQLGTFNSGMGTIEYYSGGNQTVTTALGNYNNLILSGSGTKTTTGVTVNGILSMEGTATASALPTYGTNATLQYNSSTDRTISTSPEWKSPFAATGGIVIKNTGLVTLSKAATISSGSKLTVEAGSKFTVATGITLTNNGSVIIDSGTAQDETLTLNGSFINKGTVSGTGTVTYKRFVGPNWHLLSSPVVGQTYNATWLANNGFSAATSGEYEFIDYTESSDTWDYFDKNGIVTPTGTFNSGKGYGLLRSVSAGAGAVSFIGTLNNSSVSQTLVRTGNGWNLIGNPFTSAININTTAGADNFLSVNAPSANDYANSQLDPSYAAIYIWDEASGYDGTVNNYKVITNGGTIGGAPVSLGQDLIQAGQGFMVKSKTGGGTVSFTRAMQSHSTGTPLKSATISNWYGLQLNVKATDMAAHTVVSFNDDMTKGLDVTYDAGLLRSGNGLEIYSKLINDNGVDFAVQALPTTEMDNVAVPIGVDYETGGDLTFSALVNDLPDGSSYVLQDKLNGTLTNLKTESYTVTLPPNTKGTGRFYLYTSKTDFTGLAPLSTNNPNLVVWTSNRMINIQGKLSGNANARLYDINGKLLRDVRLNDTQMNRMATPAQAQGIYLLKVIDGAWQTTKKVVIN